MPSQDSDDPSGPWRFQSPAPPEFELPIQRDSGYLKRLLLGHNPGASLKFIILILVGLSVWSSYFTAPYDSDAVVQRFGVYL